MAVRSFVLLSLLWFAGCGGPAVKPSSKKDKKATPVKVAVVEEREVTRTTTQPATVHAYYRAEVRARVAGYVAEIKADIGDYVEAGAPLAVIDVPDLREQRAVMQARVKSQKAKEKQAAAGVELAKAAVRSADAKLAEAKAAVGQADAAVAAAESEFGRMRDLVRRGSIQQKVLEESRQRRDSRRAGRLAMTSAVTSAEAKAAVARAELAAAGADLDAAEAETAVAEGRLAEANVRVGFATLKAPFAGVVTARTTDPGDLVGDLPDAAKRDPLFVVSRVDRVRVHVPVPEADAAFVRKGDAVSLSFPSFPGETVPPAGVARVASGLDPSTRTMLVEIVVENKDNKLLPGMFGRATITAAAKANANVLPARAVRFDETGKAYVYAVGGGDTVAVVPVEVGVDDGRSIEIVRGVAAGDRVVDAHLKRFAAGDRVRILNP